MENPNLVQRNKEIREQAWKALKNIRFQEEKMSEGMGVEALKAKDKELADKMRSVPTNYKDALRLYTNKSTFRAIPRVRANHFNHFFAYITCSTLVWHSIN